MLDPRSFEDIGNKRVLAKLQLPQLIKIHNIFYSNLLYKASTYLLTNQVYKTILLIIINNEKSGKWKI